MTKNFIGNLSRLISPTQVKEAILVNKYRSSLDLKGTQEPKSPNAEKLFKDKLPEVNFESKEQTKELGNLIKQALIEMYI